MPPAVYLKRSAEKELDLIPAEVHDRVVKRLLSLRDNPRPPGIRELQSREGYRIRVGHYRNGFTVNGRLARAVNDNGIGCARPILTGESDSHKQQPQDGQGQHSSDPQPLH